MANAYRVDAFEAGESAERHHPEGRRDPGKENGEQDHDDPFAQGKAVNLKYTRHPGDGGDG